MAKGDDPPRRFTGDLARLAFDTVADIQQVQSLEALDLAARRSFSALGFDVWVGFDSVTVDGTPNVNILFGHTHPEWERHYLEFGLDKHDAMIRASMNTNEPFFWSDITRATTLSKKELRVMNEASDFGLREGFVTPMHNLDGSITAVLLTGETIETSNPDVRAAAHLLSVYFGSMGRKLSRNKVLIERPFVRLTPRQLECLQWVRDGKSATDIGEILGISAYTVQEHVAAACIRLGVRTRVQAVAEAAARGILDL